MAQSGLQRLDYGTKPEHLEHSVRQAFLGAALGDVPAIVRRLGGRGDSYFADSILVGPEGLTPQLWHLSASVGVTLRFGLPRKRLTPDLRIMATLKSEGGIVTSVEGFGIVAK